MRYFLSPQKKSSIPGFTLIELLVVIAIIAMLASIILASLNTARLKARDASRAAALHQIQNAVELYSSTNGHYPNSNGRWTQFDSGQGYTNNPIISPAATNLSTALQPYISGEADPNLRAATLGSDAGYLYNGNNNAYCILIYKTPENMNDFPKTIWDTGRVTAVDGNGQCNTSGCTNAIQIDVGDLFSNGGTC